jgi:hypothetical protein
MEEPAYTNKNLSLINASRKMFGSVLPPEEGRPTK